MPGKCFRKLLLLQATLSSTQTDEPVLNGCEKLPTGPVFAVEVMGAPPNENLLTRDERREEEEALEVTAGNAEA